MIPVCENHLKSGTMHWKTHSYFDIDMDKLVSLINGVGSVV